MVDGKFSCIKEITKTVHIALPTACTSNEISGICDVLESWKRQYIQQLQGIVVSYKNVTLSSVHGYINLDNPVAHYDVTATFQLFYPTAGSILEGKINRVSHDHIGCLVHNTINVTIDQPNKLLGDLSNFIILDRVILFQITRLDFKRKIIRVRGKITRECIDLMKNSDRFKIENDELDCAPSDSNANVENCTRSRENSEIPNNSSSEEMTSDSSQSSSRKKKLKKSRSISPEKSLGFHDIVQDSSLKLQTMLDASTLISPSKKKKKHKKSKNDTLSSPPLFSESLRNDVSEVKSPQVNENKFSVINEFRNDNYLQMHMESKASSDSSDSNTHHANSPTKKKFQTDLLENNLIPNNTLHNSSFASDTHKVDLSSSKKKKVKENSLKSPSLSKKSFKVKEGNVKSAKSHKDSPKKTHKKSKSNSSHKKLAKNNNESSLTIKEEIATDSSSSSMSPSKSKKTFESFNDVYQMMEALSSFEPPPEAQLLSNISPSKIKKEKLDSPKKAKKRKRDSVDDTSSLPKKKIKKEDGIVSSKSKDKERKHKKKKKERSKKDSKKDKKKSKNKVISSKKKGHGYKVNLKKKPKKKKDKIKKEIKSEP